MGVVSSVVVRAENVVDGITIRRHPAANVVEAPVVPQYGLEEVGVGTRGNAVDRVVTAHNGGNPCVTHAALERGEIVLAQVLSGDNRVKRHAAVSVPVLQVVCGVVLAVRDDLVVCGVDTTLEALDEVEHILRGVEGVLARRFLATTPARVSEWVDVRSEEVQACAFDVVESASFGTDDIGDSFDEWVVEGGSHQDGLREGCGKAEVLSSWGEEGSRTTSNTMLKRDDQEMCASITSVGKDLQVLQTTTDTGEGRDEQLQVSY